MLHKQLRKASLERDVHSLTSLTQRIAHEVIEIARSDLYLLVLKVCHPLWLFSDLDLCVEEILWTPEWLYDNRIILTWIDDVDNESIEHFHILVRVLLKEHSERDRVGAYSFVGVDEIDHKLSSFSVANEIRRRPRKEQVAIERTQELVIVVEHDLVLATVQQCVNLNHVKQVVLLHILIFLQIVSDV